MHAMFAVVFALLGLATVTAGAATPSNSVEASFVAKGVSNIWCACLGNRY